MIRTLCLLAFLPLLGAQSPPAAPPITQVMATLTVRSGVERAAMMKVMPDEVRETLKLYLDGRIQQWFSRGDGKGVIFILNCQSVADAKALTDALPLRRENFADFDFMPLGPLMPLRMLLAPAGGKP